MQRYLKNESAQPDKKGAQPTTSFSPRIALQTDKGWRVVMPSEVGQVETAAELREIIDMIEDCLWTRYNIGPKADKRQGPPKRPIDIANIKTLEAWIAAAKKDLEVAEKREAREQREKGKGPGEK